MSKIRWTEERLAELSTKRNEGVTCEALGKYFGVSRERISQILRDHARKKREDVEAKNTASADPLTTLSVRVRNCLRAEGLYTVEAVRRADFLELMRIPNFGRKALDEVRRLKRALDQSDNGEHHG